MASGIAAVASPVGITTDVIRDGVNGLWAKSADDWFRALNRLVNDENLRRELAINARKTIEESYSLQVWGPRVVSLLDGLAGIPARVDWSSTPEQDYQSEASQGLCKNI
jgi:glycosyltransferase involved in cell wall biosynthesis